MERIYLITLIKAPIEICFNLSRSIDFHKYCFADSGEEAIGGTTDGLIGPQEEVTWEATHFGLRQQLTSKITVFNYPFHFKDEMARGLFKYLKHDHYFKNAGGITVMKDVFEFEPPFGLFGKIASKVFLKKYLKKLLEKRNQQIKDVAECHEWKKFLPVPPEIWKAV